MGLNHIYLQIVAVLAYGAAFIAQLLTVFVRRTSFRHRLWLLGSWLGCLSHAWLLHLWIDTPVGQNLSRVNVLSLVVWLSVFIMLFTALSKPVRNLSVFLYPLAIASIELGHYLPSLRIEQTGMSLKQFAHVWLGVFTFSLLCIVLFQALLFSIQDKLLRMHRLSGLLQCFPPLQTMESLLFQMVLSSFVFLSILLTTSIFSFHKMVFQWPLIQQTTLTVLAWLILAVTLWGRQVYGWRRLAVRWILFAVLLMMLSYFGMAHFFEQTAL